MVVAVGPMLDPVLAATSELDVTVAYTHTPRPFDADGLRELVAGSGASVIAGEPGASVVVVEPYLEGTSAHVVSRALATIPHRLLSLGVGRTRPAPVRHTGRSQHRPRSRPGGPPALDRRLPVIAAVAAKLPACEPVIATVAAQLSRPRTAGVRGRAGS